MWNVAIKAQAKTGAYVFGVKVSMTEAKAVKLLRPDLEVQATVVDSLFFKYMVQPGADFESMRLKLRLSQKQNLQVYIDKSRYPSLESSEHLYALGDLPDGILATMGQKTGMLELMQDMTPFTMDDQCHIRYTGSYKHMNPDLCKAEY